MLQRLQELIFALREKISDGEYLTLMNELKKVHEKIQDLKEDSDTEEEIPDPRDTTPQQVIQRMLNRVCNCQEGDWERPCFKDANILLHCRFRHEFLRDYPLSYYALIKSGLLNDDFVLTEAPPLCFEKIGGAYDFRKIIDILPVLTSFAEKITERENKIYTFIQLSDFFFRNYGFLEDYRSFKETFVQRLIEYEEQFEPIPFFPENPFTKWREIL